jgi:hypothetical protein
MQRPMSFANPAGSARDSAAAYTQALLAVLGDADPLEVQAETVTDLHTALAGISETDLRHPESPGKWSILEVVQHLADSELVTAYRIRMILAHDRPEIQGYDQDLWAERLNYNAGDAGEAIALLRLLRGVNLRLLRSLAPADWGRAGFHAERGEESIQMIARLIAAHDLVHLQQIDRIKRSFAGS